MLIDTFLPTWDVSVEEHLVVPADAETTFAAALALDLLSVRSPLVVGSMWLRGLPARLSGRSTPTPPRLVISAGVGLPGWNLLGTRDDREIVFGAVGKFWQPVIQWRDVAPADFAGFAEPGWGKIAAYFSVTPQGERQTLLTYQCRTLTTDDPSRRRFLRYWFLVRPVVRHVLRATLRTISAAAGQER